MGKTRARIEVRSEGDVCKVYADGRYVGAVGRVPGGGWLYRNHLGHGGQARSERAAFTQLGFRLARGPRARRGGTG
jgi:hypothetical protein